MNLGDNYVTGDNIYLRELQNFFFEVLGMMSITHYGAIGDGRTDNYGPLQVAIDDANRRGLSFLYVPYGRFIYTGELTNLIDPDTGKQRIIFMGNPHSKIINIRTAQEIEIHQFGWFNDEDYYTKIETDGKFVKLAGDTMTGKLTINKNGSTLSSQNALSIGNNTNSGYNTLAQGLGNTASGNCAAAHGNSTEASGNDALSSGNNTIAQGYCQLVGGFYNIANGAAGTVSNTQDLMILGNGSADANRSNAFKVTQGGEGWFSGDVYVGSTGGKNKDEGSKKLISEADLQAFATLNNLQMPS